jgi:hydrogenase expression/formation protein HypC
MCLSIPSRVTKIDKENNTATVDTMGVSREASLDLMEEGSVVIGDFVLIHIGFIMNKIDEEDALLSLETYREILDAMDAEELEKTISESDNCPNQTQG